MLKKRLFYLFTVFWLVCSAGAADAQLDFGITWNPPDQQDDFLTELEIITDSGIPQVMIHGILSVHRMNMIHESGLAVIADPGLNFPHKYFFNQHADSFVQILNRYADFYGAYTSTDGVVLTHFGAYYNQRFRSQLKEITDAFWVPNPALTPVIVTDRLLTYPEFEGFRQFVLIREDVDVMTLESEVTDAIFPFDFAPVDIRSLQAQLRILINTGNEIVWWIEGDLFLQAVHKNSAISDLFKTYAGSAEPVFPNPEPVVAEEPYNWFIIFLLILLSVYLAFFRFMPTYNKALFRYFTNHPFFIIDIFERHLRFGRTNLFLLIILSLFGGLAATVSMAHLFSGLPLETASYYIPILQTLPGIFALSGGVIFTVNVVSVLWISAACYRTEIIPQAASLQLWPQHIYIVLAVVAVALHVTGFYAGASIIIVLLVHLALFGSFFVCSMDFMVNATFSPSVHFLLTSVLYTVVLLVTAGVFVFLTYQPAVWELALYHLGERSVVAGFFGW